MMIVGMGFGVAVDKATVNFLINTPQLHSQTF
jgi:hypothetical protein